MAVLAVRGPSGLAESRPLGPGRFSIGRTAGNDLVVESPYVSRQHAILVPDGEGYHLQDLGSKNGTWVNGVRLGAAGRRLADGDVIALGNAQVTLRYHLDDATLTLTPQIPAAAVEVDVAAREVYLEGRQLIPPLTRKEFDLLALLWERRRAACSREELAARGWPERGPGDVADAEIEQYVRRLRRRLGDDGSHPRLLLTVRRYGYKLV